MQNGDVRSFGQNVDSLQDPQPQDHVLNTTATQPQHWQHFPQEASQSLRERAYNHLGETINDQRVQR